MKNDKEYKSRQRIIKVLIALIENPSGLTKKHLSDRHNVSPDSIKTDIEDIRAAGFEIICDAHYRYRIVQDKLYEHLKEVLFFTEKEQDFLQTALSKMNHAEKIYDKVSKKLDVIYDVSKLGSSIISKPFLTKINLLEKAKTAKKIVKLVAYRSTNSSEETDRLVEPFHIAPKEDILHAFDVEKNEIRHFRISRFDRVELIDLDWKHEKKHFTQATDPFRIVDDKQTKVHLRMKMMGYNELIERFPLTHPYIQPSAEEKNVFELECMVNHRFLGITNFILANHSAIIDILEPDKLIEHVNNEAIKIKF